MLQVSGLESLDNVISNFQQTAELGDKAVEVGIFDVSERKAIASKALEHRWQGAGPRVWHTSPNVAPDEAYVSWAFASRTAKTIEVGEGAQKLIDSMINSGVTGDEFYDRLGRYATQIMKACIYGVNTPPNTSLTVQRKGFDNPLVETGEMAQSVDYRIVASGDEEPIPEGIPPYLGT